MNIIKYENSPVTIHVFEGVGIHEAVVSLSRDNAQNKEKWDTQKQSGVLAQCLEAIKADGVDNNFFARMTHEADVLYHLAVDSRQSPAQPFSVGICESHIMEVEWHPAHEAEPLDCLLALDLGNTRSYALIADDIRGVNGGNDMSIHNLPIQPWLNDGWRVDNGVRNIAIDKLIASTETGVFDSLLSLTLCRSQGIATRKVAGKANAPEVSIPIPELCSPHSFLCLGKLAMDAREVLANDLRLGDFTLSSPKRYFWDDDTYVRGWKGTVRGEFGGIAAALLNGKLASKLAAGYPTAPTTAKLPRSAMVGAMLAEILEQAERFVNSPEFIRKTRLPVPRRIAKICVTYPASWSNAEVALYRERLQAGVTAHRAARGAKDAPPLLDITCDESAAVMLNFIYGEARKYGMRGENWIAAVGRKSPRQSAPPVVRIAVIDIGGGTSDLVISNITDTLPGAGMTLDITRIYQDGLNKAGDAFLLAVVQNMILEPIFKKIFRKDFKTDEDLHNRFRAWLDNPDKDSRMTNLARGFWFPLAIQVVEKCNANTSTEDIQIVFKEGVIFNYANNFIAMARKKFTEITVANVNDLQFTLPAAQAADDLQSLARQTFSSVARSFGAAIYAFDCDLVLFAGKASDIRVVKEVFDDEIALPRSKFIPLKDYAIGRFCPLAEAGIIKDSKITTVLGAAIYGLSNHGGCAIRNIRVNVSADAGIEEGNAIWATIPMHNANFPAQDAILDRERPDAWLSFNGSPILIARKRFPINSCEASVSYELRMSPNAPRGWTLAPNAQVKIKKTLTDNNSALLSIAEVNGIFKSDSETDATGAPKTRPFIKDDVQLRIRIFANDTFWLDSGKIL